MSSICCIVRTNNKHIALASSLSFMKCLSILTCFVFWCYTGFCAILMVALLSQYNFIGRVLDLLSSSRTCFSYNILQILCHSSKLCFNATSYHHTLLFVSPSNQVTLCKCIVPEHRSSIYDWFCPISISVNLNFLLHILLKQ